MKHTIIFRDAMAKGGDGRFFLKIQVPGNKTIEDVLRYKRAISENLSVYMTDIIVEIRSGK